MKIGAKEFAWFDGDDTGLSSRAIWRQMVGAPPSTRRRHWEYPSDPADLGRCIRLLNRFPRWRPRLPEMAAYGPEWAALVEHWPELEALYHEETGAAGNDPRGLWSAPRCYARMKAILRPVEDANQRPGVYRIRAPLTNSPAPDVSADPELRMIPTSYPKRAGK